LFQDEFDACRLSDLADRGREGPQALVRPGGAFQGKRGTKNRTGHEQSDSSALLQQLNHPADDGPKKLS
jgi:hypothetical protein